MKALRICIDARMAGGSAGGLEQVVLGLASGLSKLNDGNEEYLFLAYPGADGWLQPFISWPCQIIYSSSSARPPKWKRWLDLALPGVRKFWDNLSVVSGNLAVRVPESDGVIESAGIDIMHFTMQRAFLTRVPSIYHPHDLQHVHLPQFFTPRERISREVRYRRFCEQSQMVAVTSTWTKCDLIRHYGLAESKVQVVPWAPILTAYPIPTEEDLTQTRRKFHLPDTFVFYPAQTFPHKNHLGLLTALTVLRDQYGLKVAFVSTGYLNKYYLKITQQIHDLKLLDRVQFLGFVSPLELQCLYKLSCCVVIPTKFEAASFPLWEAFLAGSPVACSNVTSLPQQAGDAALIFDPDDPKEIAKALFRLWTDEALRQLLVERGKSNVAGFTWERTARTFRAHYRRIAGRILTEEDQILLTSPPLL